MTATNRTTVSHLLLPRLSICSRRREDRIWVRGQEVWTKQCLCAWQDHWTQSLTAAMAACTRQTSQSSSREEGGTPTPPTPPEEQTVDSFWVRRESVCLKDVTPGRLTMGHKALSYCKFSFRIPLYNNPIMSKSRNLSRFQKKSIFKAKHLRSSTRQVAEAISKERRLWYRQRKKILLLTAPQPRDSSAKSLKAPWNQCSDDVTWP